MLRSKAMKTNKNIVIGCTGSVASIKVPLLVEKLREQHLPFNINIKIVTTKNATHFFEPQSIPRDVPVLDDSDEWSTWRKRGDEVLHIALTKWADLLLIAPLSANSLAKMATGICNNLLMCVVRAWDMSKPLVFCPAMNTRMYEHPLTTEQINKLKSWGYLEIPCISKTLMCGDIGNGAMAEVPSIVETIINVLQCS